MEACICAYITNKELPKENETIEWIDITEQQEYKENEVDISLLSKQDNNLNEQIELTAIEIGNFYNKPQNNYETEFGVSSASADSTSASEVLAVDARNWQLKLELSEAEESIKCLEKTLHEQWSKRNKICFEMQQMMENKSKIKKDMQKQFSAHVTERNQLVHELTEARQQNILAIQEIKTAEVKSRQLKNERNETAECLYKATVELYNSRALEKTSSVKSRSQSSSSELNSETESQTTDNTGLNTSISSNESTTEMNTSMSDSESTTASNTTECCSLDLNNTECVTEKNLVSNDNESAILVELKRDNTDLRYPATKKSPNEIRLDLSFVDKEFLQNVDSGFSVTQSSTTTIRIIDATTPNILE